MFTFYSLWFMVVALILEVLFIMHLWFRGEQSLPHLENCSLLDMDDYSTVTFFHYKQTHLSENSNSEL